MKGISLLGLLTVIFCQKRLDINSKACYNYLKKFGGAADHPLGIGSTSPYFEGDIALVQNTSNVQVNLRYSDKNFNDATYFGLSQEDGKTANSTCLDLKLFKYFNKFDGPGELTNLHLSPSSNKQKRQRILSFQIQITDLSIQTTNSSNLVYVGYYSLNYFLAETTEIIQRINFQFSVTVSRSRGVPIQTALCPIYMFYDHFQLCQSMDQMHKDIEFSKEQTVNEEFNSILILVLLIVIILFLCITRVSKFQDLTLRKNKQK